MLPVTFPDVTAARDRVSPHVRRTRLVRSEALSRAASGEACLKLETDQITCSFKSRGALNALMQAPPDGRLIVTASAGNHGRAIAWAAELLGRRAVVFTPRTAPRAKTEAIIAHGADLRAGASDYEDAERQAREFAAGHGAVFISPYNNPHVVAGAGTIAIELLEQQPALDTIVVPIGGGGLISGIALAAKWLRPSIRVVGVESELSAAFSAALAAGRIVRIAVGPTIADGLGGNVEADTITWPLIREHVDQVVPASEADIIAAMRFLSAQEHVTAEGAGATAVAAVLSKAIDLRGRRAAILVTGGNIDPLRLREILA
jgi:threonine dehydratase